MIKNLIRLLKGLISGEDVSDDEINATVIILAIIVIVLAIIIAYIYIKNGSNYNVTMGFLGMDG